MSREVAPPREFRVDIGDAELAVLEWAGEGHPILLLHATGFHGRCWNAVVRHLPGRHVYAADLRFHGASDAAGEVSWDLMAADTCRLVERLDLRDLVGVGHSIGGHLIARAAARLPERFRHLVLIDPVILSPERYRRLHAELAAVAAADHPVSRRKNAWRDSEQMYRRFRHRAPFSTWQPEVLRDYCEHALAPRNGDELRRLACDPLDEAAIYLCQRGNESIFGELPRIACPVTLLRAPPRPDGSTDLSTSPTWPGLASALPDCREVYLPDMNHFIPMQDPELVAKYIAAAP